MNLLALNIGQVVESTSRHRQWRIVCNQRDMNGTMTVECHIDLCKLIKRSDLMLVDGDWWSGRHHRADVVNLPSEEGGKLNGSVARLCWRNCRSQLHADLGPKSFAVIPTIDKSSWPITKVGLYLAWNTKRCLTSSARQFAYAATV